jgi:hypothetical protein
MQSKSSSSQKTARHKNTEESILTCLRAAETPLEPKILANRIHLNYNSVKVTCRRLAQRSLVVRTETGYMLPTKDFERQLEKMLRLDGQKQSLPKIHDIHLIFKPENVRKAMSNPNLWRTDVQVGYELENREPAVSELQNAYKSSYPNIGYLSASRDFLHRFFNTIDPESIYQLWLENANKTKTLKGGFQELFDFKTYYIRIQLFGTGTIKVIIANSEHPFDAVTLREILARIDTLFVSRTGVHFFDIGHFFYFERIHFGNDVVGDLQLAGQSRLCCTIMEFDDWLYRVYEKVLGDDLYIRTESCLEKGNFEDHNLNSMLAFIQGGISPTLTTAAVFRERQDFNELTKVVRGMQNEIHQLFKLAKITLERTGIKANLKTEQKDSSFKTATDVAIDGWGPDSE